MSVVIIAVVGMLVIGISCGFIGYYYILKGKQHINQTIEEIEAKHKDEIQRQIQKKKEELKVVIDDCELQCKQARERAAAAQDDTERLIQSEQKRLAAEVSKQKEIQELKFQQETEQRKRWMDDYFRDLNQKATEIYEQKANQLSSEILFLQSQLDEFKSKQQAANEVIRRKRELEEKADFYRIIIKDTDVKDISILQSIESQLTNKEVLNRLIYKTFIERPLLDMEKRVLNGKKVSGIYKITYIKTGESYIGRSVDIGNRWKEHCLSSLSIGTIAHSTFHNVLADKGLQNFTWEVIEEVPKDKQSEREKYWINFYGTKNQFNEKEGG